MSVGLSTLTKIPERRRKDSLSLLFQGFLSMVGRPKAGASPTKGMAEESCSAHHSQEAENEKRGWREDKPS